jgi:group I intron endonuclease
MNIPSVSGVYQIICGNKIYIGSSQNCKRRTSIHLKMLRDKTHVNPKLQSSFNKHGCAIEIILICAIKDLLWYEQLLIDSFSPDLNIAKFAGAPMRGRKTQEFVLKQRIERLKGNQYTLGYKHSEETKAKLRAAHARRSSYKKRGPMSQESRRKMSLAGKGRKHTELHRKRVSEAKLKWWANKKQGFTNEKNL